MKRLGSRKKKVLDFNHIPKDLTNELVTSRMEYFRTYQKKWWMTKKFKRQCEVKRAVIGVTTALLGSAVGTANPVLLALLAAVPPLLAFLKKMNYGDKIENAKMIEVKYKETFDVIKSCMRKALLTMTNL